MINEKGEEVMLDEPTGWELPPKGFDVEDNGYLAPAEDGSRVEINVNPDIRTITIIRRLLNLLEDAITRRKIIN